MRVNVKCWTQTILLLPLALATDPCETCHDTKDYAEATCSDNNCGQVVPCLDRPAWNCPKEHESFDCSASCYSSETTAAVECSKHLCGGVKECAIEGSEGWMCDINVPSECRIYGCHNYEYAHDLCSTMGCSAASCSESPGYYTCQRPKTTPTPAPTSAPSTTSSCEVCYAKKSDALAVSTENECGPVRPCLDRPGWECPVAPDVFDCSSICYQSKIAADVDCGKNLCGGVTEGCERNGNVGFICDKSKPSACKIYGCHNKEFATDLCSMMGCAVKECDNSGFTCTTPTQTPTNDPSHVPTRLPTNLPTAEVTKTPSQAPVLPPSQAPTLGPSRAPSPSPSQVPSPSPTSKPQCYQCSFSLKSRSATCNCCGRDYTIALPFLSGSTYQERNCIKDSVRNADHYRTYPYRNFSVGCESTNINGLHYYPNPETLQERLSTCREKLAI